MSGLFSTSTPEIETPVAVEETKVVTEEGNKYKKASKKKTSDYAFSSLSSLSGGSSSSTTGRQTLGGA